MDVYGIVTNKIMEELEKGIIPWKKPWKGINGAVKHNTGKPYSLLNQFLLGMEGEWLSYNQALKEGGRVKKGEKGKVVVFWTWLEKKTDDVDDNGEQIIKRVPYLKYNTVFEVSQCEGIKRKYEVKMNENIHADENAQKTFDNYTERESIKTYHKGTRAFYNPREDSITVPEIERFDNVAEYYSTLFHEAVHSTGASKRLAREGVTGLSFFGDDEYSKEELVAEIGASMLVNISGLETESSAKNNVAYIQSWMKALANDKRLIVSASSKAEKAVKYIIGDVEEEEAV